MQPLNYPPESASGWTTWLNMHERRQSYRFRPPAGSDQVQVAGEGATALAQLLDTSAGGISLRFTAGWAPAVGQKVEVQLTDEEVLLAEAVRVERDEDASIVGLRRLSEAWSGPAQHAAVPIGKLLKRNRRFGLTGRQMAIAIGLMIVGLAVGLTVLRPNRAPQADSNAGVPNAPQQAAALQAKSAPPASSNPTAAHGSETASQPRPMIAQSPPKSVVPAARQPATSNSPPVDEVNFERLLVKLPRSIQFQYRQLETTASSRLRSLPAGVNEVQRIFSQLDAQLKALSAQYGENESSLNRAAQPALDRARQQIDALRKTQPLDGT